MERKLNPDFIKFIDANDHLAQCYTYPDLREKPNYTSSVRLNILNQHFRRFPELELKTLMYHDSALLFSRIPEIVDLAVNEVYSISDPYNDIA